MNIFILHEHPKTAAEMQCDKHVVKMILESAQMLSTAHRMLDGEKIKVPSKSGKRMVSKYVHPKPSFDSVLYGAVHHNHPCTVWTRETSANYYWHYDHFRALSYEYEYRYNKKHKSWEKLRDILSECPKNIPTGSLTQFALAMNHQPQCIIEDDPVESYRRYYHTKIEYMPMVWTRRDPPDWFRKELLNEQSG